MLGEIDDDVQRDAWCGTAVVGHQVHHQVVEQEVGVSLDAGEQAWLRRVEAELAGHAEVPHWVLVVFLVGFSTWMVAPTMGAVVAVVAACRAARLWAWRGTGRHIDEVWGRSGPGRPPVPPRGNRT